MEKTNESKSERFVRIAEARTTRACKAISLLGNLAASGYEYTDKQVDAVFEALQREVDAARAMFEKGKSKAFRF